MDDWLDLNPDPVHVKREREKARELRKTDWWKALIAKGAVGAIVFALLVAVPTSMAIVRK